MKIIILLIIEDALETQGEFYLPRLNMKGNFRKVDSNKDAYYDNVIKKVEDDQNLENSMKNLISVTTSVKKFQLYN